MSPDATPSYHWEGQRLFQSRSLNHFVSTAYGAKRARRETTVDLLAAYTLMGQGDDPRDRPS
jgi:hypothetical protein